MPICTGPCEQGRKECPCPLACEQPLSTFDSVWIWACTAMGFCTLVFLLVLGVNAAIDWLAARL